MSTDAKADAKIIAAGAERVVPRARELNANSKEGKNEERERPGVFRRFGILVAAMAAVSCGGPLERPDEDADVEEADVAAEVDSDVGPEADVELDSEVEQDADVEEGSEADAEEVPEADIEAEDGEAEASCPTHGTASETPEPPGAIGGIGQTITETYDVTTACDGSEVRELVELRVALASSASPEQLAAATIDGADTILFGETVRFTYVGLDAVEYAAHVPGASGTVRSLRSVSDGTYTAIVQDITETSVNIRVERDGTLVDYYTMAAGSYITLPSGRIVMLNSINISAIDPLMNTCELAILEAPVRVANGERTEHLGYGFFFNIEGDGADLSALDFMREYM